MIHIIEANIIGDYGDHNELLGYIGINSLIKSILSNTEFTNRYSVNDITRLKLKRNPNYKKINIEKYITDNNDISVLVITLEIFKNYQFDKTIDIINQIADKYPHIKFIVSSYETYPCLDVLNKTKQNVFYILNSFINIIDSDLTVKRPDNVINYYLMNLYSQYNYNYFINELMKIIFDMKRDKKYNFFNGVHKPHRLKCYEIIKNNNLLHEGFFSYADFAEKSKDINLYLGYAHFLDLKNEKEYLEYVKDFEIPYICDSYENTQNIFVPFSLPPQTAFQSYVSITTETAYTEELYLPISEKSFKAFHSFNIPLIFGVPMINTYLKHLGFDMFEDLFDISPKFTKHEMFEQFNKNVKVIKNMSLKELHDFYVSNKDRIIRNFENLTQVRRMDDFFKIVNFINS